MSPKPVFGWSSMLIQVSCIDPSWRNPLSPFLNNAIGYLSYENVDMLHSRDRLQGRPIPEPHDFVLWPWQILYPVHKLCLDKVLDLLPCLGRDVASERLRAESCLQPDDNMSNARSESIRPIVDQDLVVVFISKWLGVSNREGRPGPRS